MANPTQPAAMTLMLAVACASPVAIARSQDVTAETASGVSIYTMAATSSPLSRLGPTFVSSGVTRDLHDSDFAVLTASDIAMMEAALNAPIDDLDYSALFFDDDDDI